MNRDFVASFLANGYHKDVQSSLKIVKRSKNKDTSVTKGYFVSSLTAVIVAVTTAPLLAIGLTGTALAEYADSEKVGNHAPMHVNDGPWETDINKAVELAKTEKKDLFLNFTGSDWCKFCIQLEGEVLSKDDFLKAVQDKYILVTLDFPEDKSNMSEEQIKLNQEWSDKLAISGFPTIALLDAKLRPYGFLGYEEGGVEPFVTALDERMDIRKQRDELFEKAAKLEGIEKAKVLDQALELLGEELSTVYYEDVIEEIVKLDADNEAGLRNKYNEAKFAELYKAVITDVTMISRLQKPAQAISFIDEILVQIELPPAYLIKVNQIKFDLLRKADRIDEAEKLIDEMLLVEGVSDDSTLTQRLIVRKAYLLAGAERSADAYQVLDDKIAKMRDNLYLFVAKGELLDADGEYDKAIKAFDKAIASADSEPELMQTLHSAKADALFELKKYDDAIAVLNKFASNEDYPGDLRADAMLHKAIVLREQSKIENKPNLKRAAIISENKAIEVVESPQEKAEVQKIVEKLRARYSN